MRAPFSYVELEGAPVRKDTPIEARFSHVELDADHPDVEWDAYPKMLDAKHLATIFGCNVRLCYDWLKEYPGLVFKLGKLQRVPKAALRRCMERPQELAQYRRRPAEDLRYHHLRVAP